MILDSIDTITYPSLSRQIHNNIRPKRLKYGINSFFVRQISFDKGKFRELSKNIQPAFFQRNVIVVIEVVKPKDSSPRGQQPLG